MPDDSIRGRTALVTGASGGIGYETACLLAEQGCHLAVVARDEAKLSGLAHMVQQRHGTTVTVIPQDLGQPQAVPAVADALRRASVSVDILVNNAGFGTYGPFAESEAATQLQMIQVNVAALTHLTRLLLPGMVQRRWGRILNVASTAAFQPGPLMAVYYATKAYILSFSEALANELQGSGVTVTVLCPGPTITGFQQRAGVGQTRLFQGRIADARSVAAAGLQGMAQGRTVVIPGFRNQVLAFSVRLMPRRLVTAAVRHIQESRERR